MHNERLGDFIIRPAKLSDSEFVYNLRTRNEDSQFYLTGNKISKKVHVIFWQKHFSWYYILELDSVRVAFLGMVDSDFRFAVVPEQRGKGLGKLMVSYATKHLGVTQVKVSAYNYASLRCFCENGFTVVNQHSSEDSDGYFILRRIENTEKCI